MFVPNTKLYGLEVDVLDEDDNLLVNGTLVETINPFDYIVKDTFGNLFEFSLGSSTDFVLDGDKIYMYIQ